MSEGPAVMLVALLDHTDNAWEVVGEVRPAPLYPPLGPGAPVVVVRQHRSTREVRVDVYGCDEGLAVTFTNSGTNDERAKWFRDVTVNSGRYAPLRVRFLGSDLELRS